MKRPTIVTLSTIPSRFHLLEPTLRSLLSQSLRPKEIRLYIPKTYRRFPDWDGVLPKVPAGTKIVRCDFDYGPATKVLPAAKELNGQEVDILFCDDDKIYDRNWHRRLKEASNERPDCCIVDVGDSFPDIADVCRPANRLPRGKWKKKDAAYRIKRIVSLLLYKPNLSQSGYVDQIAGFGGVLVRPDWFDDKFYDIPDVMWTVDDPWISGHLERRGIPIWMTGKRKYLPETEGARVDSLLNLVEEGHDRTRADIAVIDYFRKHYGIWKKAGNSVETYSVRTAPMRELVRRRIEELQMQGRI